jgi:hypothetical protein
VRIALTDEEMAMGAAAGCARLINALSKRRVGAHGFNRNYERWQIDVEGVLTEAAAAKALNLPYTPCVGELDTLLGDIGPNLQVRGTKYSSGSLLVHDKDQDDHIFILVTGIYGVYDIRGWIKAKDGKLKKLWKEYKNRGAYWVPQDRLKPMSELVLP